MQKYYVYLHLRKSDGSVFYIGKGSGNRAYDFSSKGRNRYWKRTKEKYGVIVEIIFDNLTEEEAFQCEKDAILEHTYFGTKLCNLTLGGEGSSGLKFSDKQRLTIANSLKGRRPWNLGNRKEKEDKTYLVSEETRMKQSNAKIGKMTGLNNPFSDKNKYSFVRLSDGFEITCTRSELAENFNVSVGMIKKLFGKTPRKSASGWKLKG